MQRPRDTLILLSAIFVAIGILVGSKSLYSSVAIRMGICLIFSAYYYFRAQLGFVKAGSIAIVWLSLLISFFL